MSVVAPPALESRTVKVQARCCSMTGFGVMLTVTLEFGVVPVMVTLVVPLEAPNAVVPA